MKVNVLEEIKAIRETATIPVSIKTEQDELLVKLGRDARDILGYKPLHKAVVLKEMRLREVLQELGIEVLNPATILKYQEKLGRPHAALKKLVASSGVSIADYEDSDEEDDDGDDDEAPRRLQWGRTDISEFSAPIPAHVLQKAIEIKQALPSVEFYVEGLRAVPDPFLIAAFREEEFYIEVWEEPKFEGRTSTSAPKKIKSRA